MRNVLVTGGAKGIGEGIVRAFAEKNDRVFLCYNTSQKKAFDLENELKNKGYEVIAVKLDVTSDENIASLSKEIDEKFGGLDVLVNNAGICETSLFTDLPNENIRKMVDTNLVSVMLVTKAFLPSMIRKKNGAIINISSIWGEVGGSCEVHYSAAKAGIIGFTKALAKELGPSNITVNSVSPGCILTDMMADYTEDETAELIDETPIGRIGYPSDVANAVTFLADEKSRFITGVSLPVDGGFGR